jgi:glyoxylase-like metal-dependent hydrolase (beta-lactamase superfamily II)
MTASPSQGVRITGVAQHQAWQQRIAPPVERIGPGRWSIPVPIPDSPLRYVLVYAIELENGIALIDAGWPVESAWQALQAGIAEIGYDITDVRTVLVSHAHHDHHGLAGRVRSASGAVIAMHPLEAHTMPRQDAEPAKWSELMQRWSLSRGASAAEAVELKRRSDTLLALEPLAEPDVLIEDGSFPLGDVVGLQAIWTPGHTPGHLCFLDHARGTMLTGDHVLPRISPNISLHARASGDPLREYLASLESIGKYEPAEVLPAHEYRFHGLGARTAALIEHHRHRLAEVMDLVHGAPGATTWQVAEGLTWSRGWDETTGSLRWSAVGETLAHLVYLQNDGRLINRGAEVDSWWPC